MCHFLPPRRSHCPHPAATPPRPLLLGSPDQTDTVMARHLVELIALILLPVGMFMVVYALYVFTWRAGNIAKKKVS